MHNRTYNWHNTTAYIIYYASLLREFQIGIYFFTAHNWWLQNVFMIRSIILRGQWPTHKCGFPTDLNLNQQNLLSVGKAIGAMQLYK